MWPGRPRPKKTKTRTRPARRPKKFSPTTTSPPTAPALPARPLGLDVSCNPGNQELPANQARRWRPRPHRTNLNGWNRSSTNSIPWIAPRWAKNVLQGDDTDFPGRAKWEAELFAAKQAFVAQGRDIMKKANHLQASAKGVQDMQNPNDPRAKDLSNRLQQLMQEASSAGAAFQAVIAKGKDLAGQSASC